MIDIKHPLDKFIMDSSSKYFVDGIEDNEQITTYLGYNIVQGKSALGDVITVEVYIQTEQGSYKTLVTIAEEVDSESKMRHDWENLVIGRCKKRAYDKLVQLIMKKLYEDT